MNNQTKTVPLTRDTQVKVLLRKTVRLDKSNWYGKWILGVHGIWRGLNLGISEVSLDLGGMWVPSGFHGEGSLLLCDDGAPLPPYYFSLFSWQGWSHFTHLLSVTHLP